MICDLGFLVTVTVKRDTEGNCNQISWKLVHFIRSFHTQGALGLERLGVVPDTHRNLSCGRVLGGLEVWLVVSCEVRLCDPCARVKVNTTETTRVRPGVSRVYPGSPRCLLPRVR